MTRKIISLVISIILFGLSLSACNRTIPTLKKGSATAAAPTLDELSLTRTAIAGPIIATLTAADLTPASEASQTVVAPTEAITATPVAPAQPITVVPATQQVKATALPKPVALVQSAFILPDVYQLRGGEFPYCIARRYNINPNQLMCVNGFCYGQMFYPGHTLIIPRNPLPFPGRRALHPHPATYQVGPGDTIYKVACFFGDVDPIYLAEYNGLKPPYRLQFGQWLNIP